jgi:tetratricopeptide (TPR) repeat protein
VDDPGQAEPKLRRTLALLRGSQDSALRAEASCLHGFAVSLLGDAEAGTREIEATLRDGSLPAFVVANCHQQMAFIAENQGDGAATQRSAEAGLAILKTAERPYPKLEASLLGDLAYAEQLQGRNDSADRLYAEALAKLTALGRDRSPLAVGIQNNWAIASLAAGDIKRALALYEQSARALRERDPDGPLPPFLSGNLARALELSGRLEEH